MSDLITAILIMSVVCLIAGIAASLFLYSDKGQRMMLALAMSVFATTYFLFYASGQLFWAKLVSSSAAIIYTNLAAVFAALAAGWSLRLPQTPRWRQVGLAVMLSAMSMVAITWPLLSIALRPPPAGGDEWNGPVALQTSWETCSPAAAATLLSAEKIPTAESDMVSLCLTDSAGTPTLGLYRGIKLVADRNGRGVEILDCDLAGLLEQNDWPVLLAVELPFGVDDRRYADQWGWIPGMGHSVVALGRAADGGVLIGDPSVGLESWTQKDMEILWHGVGLRVH